MMATMRHRPTFWLLFVLLLVGSIPSSAFQPGGVLHQKSKHRASTDKHLKVIPVSNNSGGSTSPIVALNVILRIKPEVREQFLEVILNNQRGTLNKDLEPLALEYSFGEDLSEPNTFHFHEKYLGEEGIAVHNAAPHFLLWEEFAKTDPFTAPPEVYKFVIGDQAVVKL